MADKQDKNKPSPPPSGEDKPAKPTKKKTSSSSPGKRSKIEVDALKALLKTKKKPQKPDSE